MNSLLYMEDLSMQNLKSIANITNISIENTLKKDELFEILVEHN